MLGRKTSRRARRKQAAIALLAACCLAPFVAGSLLPDELPQPGAITDPPLASFTERIPGTVVSFDMVAVPADGERGAFWIAKTETTWDAFDVFVYALDEPDPSAPGADAVSRPSKPYMPPDRGFGHAGYPAISMSYHAAAEYCRWLSHKTGRRYRLPTEGEWERACAPAPADLDAVAWHAQNAAGSTHPVAAKGPNILGVHDMLGNAAEWCRPGAERPGGVARGGSYLSDRDGLSCASRTLPDPSWNASDPQLPKSRWWLSDCSFVGFRVICEPD